MEIIVTDIYSLIQKMIVSAIDFLGKIYELLARILPDAVLFSKQNAWWHNFLVGILWLVIYLGFGFLYKLFFMKQKEIMVKKALSQYNCHLFAWWQISFYIIALLIPFILYFTALSAWLNVIIGFPLLCGWIYFFIRAGSKAVFLILRQIYIVLLFCFGCFLFAPVAIPFVFIAGISFFIMKRHKKNIKINQTKDIEKHIQEDKKEDEIIADQEIKPLL